MSWDPDAQPKGELSKLAIVRITKDYLLMDENPIPGIRLIVSDSIRECHAIISGPPDTAYAGAPFLVKIVFPNEYPFLPPSCKFLTTGGGTVRFGPNLYSNGKICLSIIGTWDGPKWAPNLGLSSVLLSIQSLMSEDAAKNEPGHESAPKHEIIGLNNVLTHEVLRVAVLDQIKSVLSKKFYNDDICEAMLEHFRGSFEAHIERARKHVHLDSSPFAEPHYARVTDSGRIFRFQLLADKIEEQRNLFLKEIEGAPSTAAGASASGGASGSKSASASGGASGGASASGSESASGSGSASASGSAGASASGSGAGTELPNLPPSPVSD